MCNYMLKHLNRAGIFKKCMFNVYYYKVDSRSKLQNSFKMLLGTHHFHKFIDKFFFKLNLSIFCYLYTQYCSKLCQIMSFLDEKKMNFYIHMNKTCFQNTIKI